MEKKEINENKKLKVYEIGYLLLPTIPEEHLAAEVSKIKAVVENHGASFITEDFPKLKTLAYTMRKAVTGQNLKFDKAYFGWVKFETPESAATAIKAELDKNPNILRCMVINTVRENTIFTQKAVLKTVPSEDAVAGEEEKPKMTEEEMDKTIENLVVQ